MYAVTGITGKVGGIVARTLLAAGLPVRAVVRNVDKGRPWAEKGCEIVIASITDADGLTKAFSGVDGVFLMTPPDARLSVHARSNRGGQDRHFRRTAWEGSLPVHGRCPGGGIQSNTKVGTIAVRGGRTRLMWASARGLHDPTRLPDSADAIMPLMALSGR
jgi:hypothetical protein